MPQFTGGPSVRVTANASIELRWNTDVAWFGRVDVFDKSDATTPIFTQWAVDPLANRVAASQQVVTIPVAGPITQNTSFYFQVTAQDPGDATSTIQSPPSIPHTLVFTGVQALANVSVESITETSATIRWDANVIGTGSVALGNGMSGADPINNTAHAIQVNNLTAGTTYQFTASNLHQIDGGMLASASNQFATASPPVTQPATFVFTEPHAEPRTIQVSQASTVSIRAKNQGNPVQGVVISFAIAAGSATISATQATTDTNGIASVQVTGTKSGLVDVQVTSSSATNTPFKIPVVVK